MTRGTFIILLVMNVFPFFPLSAIKSASVILTKNTPLNVRAFCLQKEKSKKSRDDRTHQFQTQIEKVFPRGQLNLKIDLVSWKRKTKKPNLQSTVGVFLSTKSRCTYMMISRVSWILNDENTHKRTTKKSRRVGKARDINN